jgi:SAM-dependent methyltransferase
MRQAGFSTFGIEPSQTGSGYSRSAHGIDTFGGSVEDYLATKPDRAFNVVTMLNVLEHIPNPKQTLLELRQLMAPAGFLVVVVPDARFHAVVGGIRRRMGTRDPYWLEDPLGHLSGFKLPDHLCSFQPRTISLLLQRCGFAIKSMRNAPVVLNAQFHRNLAKLVVFFLSHGLQSLTMGKFLLGYSTLIVAQKCQESVIMGSADRPLLPVAGR